MKFVALDPAGIIWQELDAYADRMFSQRRSWLEFVARISAGKIIIAKLVKGTEVLGYYSGILFHRIGVPILGSPFKAWTTTYMGFNPAPGVSRRDALKALRQFAFHELGCLHLEVLDRYTTMQDVAGLEVDVTVEPTYGSPLHLDDEEIFAGMNSACRRCIRKAEKNGLIIEEAAPDGFGDEYHEQLIDVFAKQKLDPPYSKQYVQTLIDKIHPSGDALLLRAKTPAGQRIASAIYFGHGEHSMFWGNGSLRSHQILRPNEALHWYALKYWKRRGIKFHDWCGPDGYKRKFGPQLLEIPRILISRNRAIKWSRDAGLRLYTLPRLIKRHQYLTKLGQNKRR